jgi:hypothetical protein
MVEMIDLDPSLSSLILEMDGRKSVEENSDIYFGIGLSRKKKSMKHMIDNIFPYVKDDVLSYEMPFDVLGMILPAEFMKRKVGGRAIILIADEHAKVNDSYEHEINGLAKMNEELFNRIINRFGFSNWEIYMASDIAGTDKYQKIHKDLSHIKNPYVRLEITDIEYLKQVENVQSKEGWMSLTGDRNGETKFDKIHQELYELDPINYTYVHPGFNQHGIECTPYINSPDRLNLSKDFIDEIRGFVKRSNKKNTKDFYRKIVNEYENLAGPLKKGNLATKIEDLYSIIFN